MTDRTPKPSRPDDELRQAIEDYQWRWTDFKPGEDAEMDAEIKRVVDEQMALIQADRERLYGELVATKQTCYDCNHDDESKGLYTVPYVSLTDINKVFNREGAES